MDIRIQIFFLNHSNLLFPNCLRTFFQLDVELLEFVAIGGEASTSWVDGVYAFEFVSWKILINEIMIESHPFAVLPDSHSSYVSILHGEFLLLFEHNILLTPLFDTQLKDLEHVPDKVMLNIMVNFCVCSEAWHVVYLKHPWFQFMVKHDVEPEKITAEIGLLCLTCPVEMLELWLHHKNCFDNDLLYFMPYLLGVFSICFPTRLAYEFTFEHVAKP